jgi:hypothetical protein
MGQRSQCEWKFILHRDVAPEVSHGRAPAVKGRLLALDDSGLLPMDMTRHTRLVLHEWLEFKPGNDRLVTARSSQWRAG